MKLRCDCGHQVSDSTDYVPYKGYVIADEDYFGVLNAIREDLSAPSAASDPAGTARRIMGRVSRAAKVIYQCEACGLLLWPGNGEGYFGFKPVDDPAPRTALRGITGVRG